MSNEQDSKVWLSELDVVKTVLIFLMIMGHVEEVIFSYVWEDLAFSPSSGLMLALTGMTIVCGPAFFMFSMGMAINFSRRREPELWIRRGFWLILTWFLLKASYCLVGIRHVAASGLTPWQFCIQYIFYSDILCFAGLFFVIMGFLRKLKAPKTLVALLALGLFCAGQFISLEPTTPCKSLTIFVQAILGLFVSTPITAFPFFHWVLHPLLGLAWGFLLLKSRNRDRFFVYSLAVSIPVLAGCIVWQYIALVQSGEFSKSEFLEMGYVVKPVVLGISFSAFVALCSLLHFVVRWIASSWFMKICGFIGPRLTIIYCLQWILIPLTDSFLPMWPEGKVFSPVIVLAFVVPIFCLAVALAEPVRRLKVRVFGGR